MNSIDSLICQDFENVDDSYRFAEIIEDEDMNMEMDKTILGSVIEDNRIFRQNQYIFNFHYIQFLVDFLTQMPQIKANNYQYFSLFSPFIFNFQRCFTS